MNVLFLKYENAVIAFFPDVHDIRHHENTGQRQALDSTGTFFWLSPVVAEGLPRATREEAAKMYASLVDGYRNPVPLNNWPATADDYTLIETSFVFANKSRPSDTVIVANNTATNTWSCADLDYNHNVDLIYSVDEKGARSVLTRALAQQ